MAGDPSDEELMLRVRGGAAAEAFATLYERHKNGLLNFCFQMLRNWEDAGDVFQDAFRYVYTHAATYQPTAKFSTYLYRIGRNMCIDILRRRRRWNLKSLDAEPALPEGAAAEGSPLEREEAERKILKALDDVPEPYREVLHLRVAEDMPYEEIAAVLECPIGTVKSRLHAGLALLREALKRKRVVE